MATGKPACKRPFIADKVHTDHCKSNGWNHILWKIHSTNTTAQKNIKLQKIANTRKHLICRKHKQAKPARPAKRPQSNHSISDTHKNKNIVSLPCANINKQHF